MPRFGSHTPAAGDRSDSSGCESRSRPAFTRLVILDVARLRAQLPHSALDLASVGRSLPFSRPSMTPFDAVAPRAEVRREPCFTSSRLLSVSRGQTAHIEVRSESNPVQLH
jgi:hypothetical protein